MNDDDMAAAFALLADRLIPAAEDMPAASEAADLKAGLAQVLNARPDLRGDVMRGLLRVHREGVDAVEAIAASDTDAWSALTLAAATCYYESATVRTVLGYRGPERRTYDADATPDYVTDGLLDRVKARGPIWRPA